MSPARYRELAYGSAPRIVGGEAHSAREALPDCARCHGEDGFGRGRPEIPILAGQNAEYLYAALAAYAAGERPSGVMQAAAACVDDDAFADLARHYSALPGGLSRAPLSSEAEDELALRIVLRGLPEANLPACSRCHARPRRANYPVLAGQNEVYLAGRLRNWRGDPNIIDAHKSNAPMPVIARRIPEEND